MHEISHPTLVERLERIRREDLFVEVVGEKPLLRVVAREAERRLRQVVQSEAEEIRLGCDLIRAYTGAG